MRSSPRGGWYVLTHGVSTFCSAVCPLPFERSTFLVGKKGRISVNMVVQNHPDDWLLKYQTSAQKLNASCSTGRREPSKVRGFNLTSCWNQTGLLGLFSSLPQELYWQLSKEWENTSFTESSLVNSCLVWVHLEPRYWCFYGWVHCGTKPGIAFCVKLINAQKIQTWDWLLCSKKKKNTVQEYKKKLSSANIFIQWNLIQCSLK